MDYQKCNIRLFAGFTAAILILGGCAQMEKKAQVCPGKASATESLSSLKAQSGNAVPLRADGQCLLQYYAEDRKPKKENFPVKLWVNPPAEIYMQGDVAFDPKGVILGSNKEEFWLAVRLKEVSGYWWGQWSERDYPEQRLYLEALGSIMAGDEDGWSLSNNGAFDVLTKQEEGIEVKKIYISTCDYLVRKIEYLGRDGKAIIVMELDKYREISKNFFVPAVVKIVNRSGVSKVDSVQITLGTVKPMEFTDKQRERLFIRSQAQGFKHVYKFGERKFIEQPQ